MTLDIGHQLQQGRYQIRALLGRGGMGTVYLATDRNLSERQVAIKENADTAAATQEQFQHEAHLLSRLTHPNLPRVTDHFIEPSGRQYLVMDYIEGDDLRTLLRMHHGPLPEEMVLGWLDQVFDALSYMHNWIDPTTRKPTPIIHRDIKPGNIKRTPNGRIVLVDFGVAKIDETTEGTIAGAKAITPGYSPLEQYTGGTDARSDIYALGATLYMLLTGQRPPNATALASGTPLPPPRQFNRQVSRTTERVILRALALRAADRFQTIEEMRAALPRPRDLSAQERLSSPLMQGTPAFALQHPQRRPQRNRWTYWSTLGALVILTFFVGVAMVLPMNPWTTIWSTLMTTAARTPSSTTIQTGSGGQVDAVTTPQLIAQRTVATATVSSTVATATVSSTVAAVQSAPSVTEISATKVADAPSSAIEISVTATTVTQVAAAVAVTETAPITAQTALSPTEPTATPQATETATPLPSPTPSATATLLPTATPTATATSAATPTPTSTATATVLPTSTATASPTPSPTALPTPEIKTEPTTEPTVPVAGDALVHEPDGARYRFVPAGSFPMGSTFNSDEMPIHEVTLDAFWLMETEVTNALYSRCVADDACTPPHNTLWQDPELADHPVTHVDWNQATAYAEWVGGQLPTEAEWEKAARSTDERLFPWADDVTDDEHLNFNTQTTMPVGSFPAGASPYGVLDMAGNVEEWVFDWYSPTYYAESPTTNPTGPDTGLFRVVRGGSFTSNRGMVRAAARGRAVPDSAFAAVGFRVRLPAPQTD